MAILRANLFFKFHLIVFQLCDSSFMNIAEQNTNPQPFFKNRWIDHFFTVNKSLNQFTVQTLTYFYNQTADSVCVCVCMCVCVAVSDSFATPWTVVCQAHLSIGFPSKNTGLVWHVLLQGIFLTQRPNLRLLHCKVNFLSLSHQISCQR